MNISQQNLNNNNNLQNSNSSYPKALPLVLFEDNKFIIQEEAKNLLSQSKYKNIGIISLVGKYRTGKSFLLNRVILNTNQTSGFGVGPTFKPCTKGIWIWSEPLTISNVHSPTPFPCFLIDTEGLGAYDEEINHDSKIFLIAILISSLFIFNSFGAIDETAINSLSFVLNLSKTIKIKNKKSNLSNKLSEEENEAELAQYFPTLLWLLRDFSLKLEDKDGNVITEKQYLENALEEKSGSSESIEEKNRVRNLIKTYFTEKDCFVMVRPVEKEEDLQNLQNLPNDKLRKEFLEQSKIFRNKVMKKTKPKTFNKMPLSGQMMIELIQSILDSINMGSIPVIENSWKYVLETEFIKTSKTLVENFIDEIKKYREKNKDDMKIMNNIKNYSRDLSKKYIDDYLKNHVLDEDSKKDFSEKLNSKINSELIKFDKENSKIFEEKFIKELDNLSSKFISNFSGDNNIYSQNFPKFFEDFENFRETIKNLTPDFETKNELITDKIISILKQFFNEQITRIKEENEKKIGLMNLDIEQYKEKIKELNDEIEKSKEKNKNHFTKLTNDIINEKLKHKNIEEKMNNLLNSKKTDQENYLKQIDLMKNNYEEKIKDLTTKNKKIRDELKSTSDEFLLSKLNNDKINSLNEQKFSFLEKEINTWKEKYNHILKESKNKENNLNQEIGALRGEIKKLKTEKENNQNINTDKLNNNLNDLMKYFKDNFKAQNEENKNMIEKMLKEKENNNSNDKELFKNYNDMVMKNSDLQIKLNTINYEKTNLEKKIENLNVYKTIVENTKLFKCKKCKNFFAYEDFKNHYANCEQNVNDENSNIINNNNLENNKLLRNKNSNILASMDIINNNMYNNSNQIHKFNPDKLKIKILKGKLKTDELGKPYLEYILDINYFSQNWRLNKTFNQFANLHKTINSMFKNSITMPSSANIFTDFGSNKSGSFYQNKIIHMEKFLKEIAEIEEINSSKTFRKFLELEQNFDEENELMFLRTNEKPKKFQNYYKINNRDNVNNINNSNKNTNGNYNNNTNNGFNNRYDDEGNFEMEQNNNNK